MKRLVSTILLIPVFSALQALASPAVPQEPRVTTDDEWCREYRGDRDRESHCEVRELTLPAAPTLEIRQVSNGSIAVTGGTRSDIRIRARVIASASTVEAARQLAKEITISTTSGRIAAAGPRSERQRQWWVSYRAEVPSAQDVDLETANGSITIADLKSRVRAETANGSLRLSATSGDVDVRTANGSMNIQLTGTTWEGTGLRATASNGSVRMDVPDNYNARLRASTGNGSLSVSFPLTVQGRLTDDVDTVLGKGGPTIDLRTSNGSIRIGRAAGR